MKSLLLVSVILAIHLDLSQGAANPQQVREKVTALSKKCVADIKLPEEKAKIAFNQEIPNDEGERCFLECMYKGTDLVSGQKFNLDGAKKLVSSRFTGKDATTANKLVETCNKEIVAKADEKCSLGRAVRECFAKNGKTVNFFPSAA